MNSLLHQTMETQLTQDQMVDKMLRDLDDTVMPLPSIDDPDLQPDPHILIGKVRQEYFDHLIKYLSVNYETNQKLLGKNIYLPSAIWRCAKYMELHALKLCMVADLYRKNMCHMINELKVDTKKGKLNKKLFNCLKRPPLNEKKLQTTACTCQCTCSFVAAKRRKTVSSTATVNNDFMITDIAETTVKRTHATQASGLINNNNQPATVNSVTAVSKPTESFTQANKVHLLNLPRMSTESQPPEDEVMLQMEQLFRGDSHEPEDDLFEGTLCDDVDLPVHEKPQEAAGNSVVDAAQNNALQIKSLDERLAILESSGALNIKEPAPAKEIQKPKKPMFTKWLCETYYQKKNLYECMDDIRERNRKKHMRIRLKFYDYFGDDSDGEDEVMSPLEETPEFIRSCKERIAPWVVKLLTPHYVKGRIIGKALFKACAKHLINLIIICSQYPSEHDVKSFITDFLKTHKMIRCEADFIEFKIDNI